MRPVLAEEFRRFLIGLQYFTRVPIPPSVEFSQDRLDRSLCYLPLIGIFVGSVQAATFDLAQTVWPMPVAVVLAITAGVLLTGGLHEDGLADTADGLFGASDRTTILAIMKDSRLGSFGALALLLSMFLRVACLIGLPPFGVVVGLIAAQAFSRLMALVVMQSLTYARTEATRPKPAAISLGTTGWLVAIGVAVVPLLTLVRHGWLGAAGAIGVTLLITRACQRRLGGYTGDCLGAVQQTGEIAVYLGLLA